MSIAKNQKKTKKIIKDFRDILRIFELNSDLERDFYIDFNLPTWYCNHDGNLLTSRLIVTILT